MVQIYVCYFVLGWVSDFQILFGRPSGPCGITITHCFYILVLTRKCAEKTRDLSKLSLLFEFTWLSEVLNYCHIIFSLLSGIQDNG